MGTEVAWWVRACLDSLMNRVQTWSGVTSGVLWCL